MQVQVKTGSINIEVGTIIENLDRRAQVLVPGIFAFGLAKLQVTALGPTWIGCYNPATNRHTSISIDRFIKTYGHRNGYRLAQ